MAGKFVSRLYLDITHIFMNRIIAQNFNGDRIAPAGVGEGHVNWGTLPPNMEVETLLGCAYWIKINESDPLGKDETPKEGTHYTIIKPEDWQPRQVVWADGIVAGYQTAGDKITILGGHLRVGRTLADGTKGARITIVNSTMPQATFSDNACMDVEGVHTPPTPTSNDS